MNVREIVEAHLRQVGAEGLCHELDECGCRMSGLAPCGELSSECVPAVRVKCGADCERCEGSGCMVPMSENRGIRHLHHASASYLLAKIIEQLEERITNKGQYLSETVEDARHDLNVLAEARLYKPKEPTP